jgi:large subunit ribosomal protein L11
MAAKKIKTFIKLNIPAGSATAAPPVGPALGQHGLPIMEFVKAFNEKTADKQGNILPVVITVFEDRTFSFITKEPPVAEMIKKALSLSKGSGKALKEPVGTLNQAQVRQIAEAKLPDLNTRNVEAAMKIVEGTARSMGVKVGS